MILAALTIKILREYERAVVFFLGRVQRVFGPGIIFIIPGVQQIVRVDLRIRVFDVPPQDIITRDNVSVKVNAVLYMRVSDPAKAVIEIEDYLYATSQLAQTTLRSEIGKIDLDKTIKADGATPDQVKKIGEASCVPSAEKLMTSGATSVEAEQYRRLALREVST